MNERNLKDLINCDSTDKEKMMEAAKEKLRWYTFEASEEEYDVEAVDALVRFLREAEPELGVISEDEKDKSVHVQKRRVIEWNRGKIAAAVVIGVLTLTLASIIVGNSLGTSLAWEDGGFFKWLQRDKEGQTVITSPEDLGMEDGKIEFYYKISEVPLEYQNYLIEPDILDRQSNMSIQAIRINVEGAFLKISENILMNNDNELKLGVVIFEDELSVVRDSFDDFEYLRSENNGICEQNIFAKRTCDMEIEYAICFFESNRKYYISSQMSLDKLRDIANNYMKSMLNK